MTHRGPHVSLVRMKIQSVRGMNDIMVPEIKVWQHIESAVRKVYESFGYFEIRTPVLEMTALFKRGVGQDTDIVEKEMYSFEDRSGDNLSLRPEGTASVVRALNEHSWLNDNPVTKFYYIGPMFRHERPQKGRLRQFHQYGIELVGVAEPLADAEVMAAQNQLYNELGITSRELRLSSIGCTECRPSYKKKLIELLEPLKAQIPEDFHPRIYTNPQRIFDHKNPKCQEIAIGLPTMLDNLCDACRAHFSEVKRWLEIFNVPFVVDPKIVRGLDYYNRTAFEFTSNMLGAQSAIGGGGRYDNMIGDLGGRHSPAVGFAGGMERLIILLENQKIEAKEIEVVVVYPDPIGGEGAQRLALELRAAGIRTEVDLQGRQMKNQLKRADKFQAKFCVIIGENEVSKKLVQIKDMAAKTQAEISLDNVLGYLSDRLKNTIKN